MVFEYNSSQLCRKAPMEPIMDGAQTRDISTRLVLASLAYSMLSG